jgi:predicted protein tyrosine phosphatase
VTYPPVVILGYSEASMFVRQTLMSDIGGVLSIHGVREPSIECICEPRLDLEFDDVEVVVEGDTEALLRQSARRRSSAANGLREVGPTVDDAAKVISFARDVANSDRVIVCHCFAGMSRSPAAALICMAVWNPDASPDDLVASVLQLRRGAVPHVGLVRLADELLGHRDSLATAVRRAQA